MIHIKNVWKEDHDDYTYAMAQLEIDPETCKQWEAYCERKENKIYSNYLGDSYVSTMSGESVLWFSVDKKYGEYLCVDRADAFLLSLLHFALGTGSDIKSDVPVSSELLYHIRIELIPHLCTGDFRRICVEAPITYDAFPSKGAAATGMSCGVDSFFTVWQNTQDKVPDDYRVKYLTFFNVGAVNGVFPDGLDLKRRNELMLEISRKKAAEANEVATAMGVELIFVNSNISDYYRGMLVNSAHYRNCGTAMLLQGLWSTYYYSSAGFKPDDVKYELCDDPAFHEAMLLPWFSNGTIKFISAGHAYSRIQKIELLADFALARKYLNVCNLDKNCGKCIKCIRTICDLIALDKLDRFKECFDVSSIKRDMSGYKRYIYLKRKQRHYDEIFEAAKRTGLYSVVDDVVYSAMTVPYEILHNKSKLWYKYRKSKYAKSVKVVK